MYLVLGVSQNWVLVLLFLGIRGGFGVNVKVNLV